MCPHHAFVSLGGGSLGDDMAFISYLLEVDAAVVAPPDAGD